MLLLIVFLSLHFYKKRTHHSILKLHPYLGRMRYLLEKIGPEFRQYWFDHDTDGKPFSRYDFQSVMFLAKYRSEILGFGSKRDFEASGYYIANTLFPILTEELSVNLTQEREGKKYVIHKEGLFSRREKLTADTTNLWLYEEDDAIIVGENRKYPWKLHGMFGASATSYGAIGENYILASGLGAKWQADRGLIRVKVALFQNIYIQERISLRKLVQGYLDTVMKTVIFQWENSWRK